GAWRLRRGGDLVGSQRLAMGVEVFDHLDHAVDAAPPAARSGARALDIERVAAAAARRLMFLAVDAPGHGFTPFLVAANDIRRRHNYTITRARQTGRCLPSLLARTVAARSRHNADAS